MHFYFYRTATNGDYIISTAKVGRRDCDIRYIENVFVTTDISYSKLRGYTEIDLVSPRRTLSPLLTYRPADNAETMTPGNIVAYLRSVHFWGENTVGIWKLRIRSISKFVEGLIF